jgi:Tfp pilus assembly protein PilX
MRLLPAIFPSKFLLINPHTTMKRAELLNLWVHCLVKLQKPQSQEGGYILVIIMGMVLVISGLFLTTSLTSKVDTASSRAVDQNTTGFYAAEAGLNLRAQTVRKTFEGYNRPTGDAPDNWAACRNGDSDGSGDFMCQNFDDRFQSIVDKANTTTLAQKLQYIPVSTFVTEDRSNPSNIRIPSGEAFAGLNAQEYRYDVTSVAFTQSSNAQPTAILKMAFKSRLVPLFQFAAFYENDLDFSRPAQMSLSGPIHSNSNLYLNSAQPVDIRGQLSSAGKMYRGEKATGQSCNPGNNPSYGGAFRVHDPVLDNGTAVADNLVAIPCNGTPRSEITTDAQHNNLYVGGTLVNNFNGQIRPGIDRLTVPPTSFLDAKLPDATDKYEYWNNADLRIALKLSNSDEAPVSIEVVDVSKNNLISATNTLNSSTCLPTSTTTTLALGADNGSGYSSGADPTANSTEITVANAANLSAGDPIRITRSSDSINDFDENVILSKNGNRLTLARPLGKQAINVAAGTVTVQKAVVWSSKTFYNYREKTLSPAASDTEKGRLIRMLNVDIQGLMTCASNLMGKSLNEASDGGLVWHFTVLGPNSETDITASGTPNNYGVRIYNGATLASTNGADPAIRGLTVVSDQAMYVRGDYNSNNKKPAAIMADSINVLSNRSPLSDRYTCQASGYDAIYNATNCNPAGITDVRSDRDASNTTINAAFLAGVDITGGVNGEPNNGSKSGGLNNYMRLHENWDGVTLQYRGSMVSLGRARRVNGLFGEVGWPYNVYTAPTRNWDYDTDFNTAEKLPPLTPRFVYLRQERFSRDYEQQAFRPLAQPSRLASLLPHQLVSVLATAAVPKFSF